MTDTIRGGVDAGRMPTRLMRAPLVFLATLAVVAVAASPAAATFGAPFDLSKAGRSAVLPQVALDANGDAVFACERFDGTNHLRIRSLPGIASTARTGGSRLGRAAPPGSSGLCRPSDAGQNAPLPEVAVDPAGDATSVWSRSDGALNRIQTAIGP